ncbi:MAG: AMP-binding protein [Burkholderiales bacterium]
MNATTAATVYSGGTLGEIIAAAVLRHGARAAFIDGEITWSYRATGEAISRAMQQLSALGLKKGDAVAQLSGNQAEMFFIMAACYLLGLKSVTLHAQGSVDDHAYIVADSEARVFVAGVDYIARAAQIRPRCGGVQAWFTHAPAKIEDMRNFWQEAARFAPLPLCPQAEPEDIIRIAYTGGTTGRPKGVMLSDRALATNTLLFLAEMEWPAEVRVLSPAPISHGAGAMIVPTLSRGGTMVLQQGFERDRVLDDIEKHRITAMFLVPTMIYTLLDHPRTRSADLSSMQLLYYAASPMAPARIREAIEVFGPILNQGYGQTEAPNAILLMRKADHLADNAERLSAAGMPYPGVTVRLFDDDDREVAPGESGEIRVRSALVMSGYWKQPEETARTLKNGWLHTGDIAFRDEDGFYHIVDRKKDMIISGGFNVYPREVEDVLAAHPAVAAAAVIGVPDEKWGEAVKAVVVLRAGARADVAELSAEFIDLVRAKKGAIHAPKSVDFVDSLPLTAVGKPDKKALRAPYWSGVARAVS